MAMKASLIRALLWASVAALLVIVFMAYLSPQVVMDLAARAWSCF